MRVGDDIFCRAALLCEDVREEVRNKHSVVGVISGDVVVSEFPAKIRVAAYIEIEVNRIGVMPLHMRFSYTGADEIIMTGQIEQKTIGSGNVALQSFIAQLEKPGDLKVALSQDRENWVDVISRRVYADPAVLLPLTPAA